MTTTVASGAGDLSSTQSKRLSVTSSIGGTVKTYTVSPNLARTSFLVYESDEFGQAGTTHGPYNFGNALRNWNRMVVELGHDETYIDVICLCGDTSVRHRRINLNTWTSTNEATVWPNTNNITPYNMDLSVSDTGAVIVGIMYGGPNGDKAGYIVRIRDTGGTWRAVRKATLSTNNTAIEYNVTDVAINWYSDVDSNIRRFAVMPSWGNTSSDFGIRHIHCSINETNGTAFSFKDLGYLSNGKLADTKSTSFKGQPRKVWIYRPHTTSNPKLYVGALFYRNPNLQALTAVIRRQATGANAAGDTVEFVANERTMPHKAVPSSFEAMGVTFAYNSSGVPVMNFVAPTDTYADKKTRLYNIAVRLNFTEPGSLTTSATYNGDYQYPDLAPISIQGGSGWKHHTRHPMTLFSNTGSRLLGLSVVPPLSAVSATPTGGQVVPSSNPEVGMSVLTIPWNLASPKFIPIWSASRDPLFATGVADYQAAEASLSPYSTPGGVSIIKQEWKAFPFDAGTWYIRAAVRDMYGNQSGWTSSVATFTVSHPGGAKSLNPPYTADVPQAFAYVDQGGLGYSLVPVSWEFSDAWTPDYQTAYQATAFDIETSDIVYDTGKITSDAKNTLLQIPLESAGLVIEWRIKTWDMFDESTDPQAVGTTQSGTFISYPPPHFVDVVPLSIDEEGNVNSNSPSFAWEVEFSTYEVIKVGFTITQGDRSIYSTSANVAAPSGILKGSSVDLENDSDYTVTFTAWDSTGMTANYSLPIHTLWTPPPGVQNIAIDTDSYNTENKGYISIRWGDTQREEDTFVSWNIYRRVDLIDRLGTVLQEGELTLIAIDTTLQDAYEYRDYYAPSGARVAYLVRQVVDRFGATVESVNTLLTYSYPESDGYWLIDPTPEDEGNSAFKLSNVVEDSYSVVYEEQEINLIGRGRHIDRGDRLGVEGSLTCQLRDSAFSTARQKKLRLENIREEARSLFLRNPFGDAIFVNVGQLDVQRIAGVGVAEFCDMTVPYTEVYSV